MTTLVDAPKWIMNEVYGGAYDAAGCMAVSEYHRFVLHERELEEAGEISAEPKFKERRAKIADNFDPELIAKINEMHAALPAHRYLTQED